MDRPKLSIARLMIWVAVIAVDAAVLRFLWVGGEIVRNFTVMFGLLGLSIQIGFLRALSGGRGPRIFWAGYAVGGGAAALSWLWFLFATQDVQLPIISAFWRVYPDWIGVPFATFPRLGRLIRGNRVTFVAWKAITAFLPLGLTGVAVGAWAEAIDRRDSARARVLAR